MIDALPCPLCGDDSQTGPSWNEDESIVWWDCECGVTGPEMHNMDAAIVFWNDMVVRANSHLETIT